MSIRLAFRIALWEDYHAGAGHGRGPTLDSALLRDADGVPTLRAAPRGLLRDALRSLLALPSLAAHGRRCRASGADGPTAPDYCGQGRPAVALVDPCPACAIFGTPRVPGRWRVRRARPAGLEAPLRVIWAAGRGGRPAAHVRVDPRTRRAAPGLLYAEEVGDRRLGLGFTVATDADDAAAAAEAALLVAAARAVRAIGRGRRGGVGECRLRLADDAGPGLPAPPPGTTLEAALLDAVPQHWFGPGRAAAPPPAPRPRPPLAPPTGPPVRVRLVARTDEVVVLARRGEAGNQFETLPFVPGVAVHGALARRAARELPGGRVPAGAADHPFVALFARDGVRCGPLMPAPRTGDELTPAIPTPLDLATCALAPGARVRSRAAGHGLWTRAFDPAAPAAACPECGGRLEAPAPFLPLDGGRPFHTPREVELQHRHDPATGGAATGDLYGYVALQSGQYLLGELTCADAARWAALRELADLPEAGQPFELLVGRARGRGHGALLAAWELAGDGPDPLVGSPLAARLGEVGAWLTLTLLGDAVVADPWGRAPLGFASDWLGRELGLAVEVDPDRSFAAVRAVDGFNATHGLPRARDLALAAGSTARLRPVDSPAAPELLARLGRAETEGIGRRRSHGFGRVAINHPALAAIAAKRPPSAPRVAIPAALQPGEDAHPLSAAEAALSDFRRRLGQAPLGAWRAGGPAPPAAARLLAEAEASDAAALEVALRALAGPVRPGQPARELPGLEAVLEPLRELEAALGKAATLTPAGRAEAWRRGRRLAAERVGAEARRAIEEGGR